MTYTAFSQADWGTALGSLRDQVSAETNWTNPVDDAAGGSLTSGDSFILGTPASDSGVSEYIEVELGGTYGGIIVKHGTGEDGNTVTGRWDFDPANAEELTANYTALPRSSPDDTDPVQATDSGSYWLTSVARGFCFYWQREESDGVDGDMFLGLVEVNKAWNYHNAANDETEWCLAFGDSANSAQRIIYVSSSGNIDGSGNNNQIAGNNDYPSRGFVNPDQNFDNYPVTNNVVSSTTFKNITGEDIVTGKYDLLGEDRSGSDTGHRDLIVDASDNPVFTVLKRSDTPSIIMRQA